MKKSAFTLIELLVVIAIIMIITSFTMINYFNFQQRQRVENSAKEAIVYLRRIQNHARVGNRGEGSGCNPGNLGTVAAGDNRLRAWTTRISSTGFESQAHCVDTNNNLVGTSNVIPQDIFTLPRGLTLDFDANKNMLRFSSLFGDTSIGNSSNLDLKRDDFPDKNARFIVTDGTYYYQFALDQGTITNGCFCKTDTDLSTCDIAGKCP